ncbi:MAG: cobalt ABC transporter permease [Nitrospirae bacterium]|nr:cobalt ABC transporter permease [Nitrospirota bacterium]MBI5696415.1 cobalt ABC transporter permease [Nitrospirota bacterium]
MPFLLLFLLFSSGIAHAAEEKWPGVDEAVVGKYAEEHGRPAKPSLLELEGDTLLFAFLVAGAAGGFVLGYYYREFISRPCAGSRTDAR